MTDKTTCMYKAFEGLSSVFPFAWLKVNIWPEEAIFGRKIITLSFVLICLINWLSGTPSLHAAGPLMAVYEVSTRNDFVLDLTTVPPTVVLRVAPEAYHTSDGGALKSGGSVARLDDLYSNGCGREVAVVVHGWMNDEEGALEKFDRARLSLAANNYPGPIIGYSWDSDVGSWAGWYAANDVAVLNGPKLAHFITDFKTYCPNTELRLLAHSLGARVVIEAINRLRSNDVWKNGGYKIRSVSLLGAAIPNNIIATGTGLGSGIEANVQRFYNYYSDDDDVLGSVYELAQGIRDWNPHALGMWGVANDHISLPFHYQETNVHDELKANAFSDGGTVCDYPYFLSIWFCSVDIGHNHFGYLGFRSRAHNESLLDDGAMNIVVRDWDKEVLPTISISPIPPIIVEATFKTGASVNYKVTVSDNIAGPNTATCQPASGSIFPIGETTVKCAAWEDYVRKADWSGTCVETSVGDEGNYKSSCTVDPQFGQALYCFPRTGGWTCNPNPKLEITNFVCNDPVSTMNPKTGERQVRIVCTGQGWDPSPDRAIKNFVVEVADTTPPVVKVSSDITVGATGPNGAIVMFFPDATANDLVDGPVPVSCFPSSGSLFHVGKTTVTCTAGDSHGNMAVAQFVVTVMESGAGDTRIISAIDGSGAALSQGSFTLFQPTTFGFTDFVSVGSFECSLDNSRLFLPCDNPQTFNGLPFGSHTFRVRAHYSGRSGAPDTFTWTIMTAAMAVQKLSDQVKGMAIDVGAKSILLVTLERAELILNDRNPNNDVLACPVLDNFISLVNGYLLQGIRLPRDEAAQLLVLANNIEMYLGCEGVPIILKERAQKSTAPSAGSSLLGASR